MIVVEDAPNRCLQIGGRVRLLEDRVTPGSVRTVGVGRKGRVTCHREYRHITRARILFEATRQFEPINAGDIQVRYDDVRGEFDSTLQRLQTIVRLRYTKAGMLQPFDQHQPAVAVVFDDENAGAAAVLCQLRLLI